MKIAIGVLVAVVMVTGVAAGVSGVAWLTLAGAVVGLVATVLLDRAGVLEIAAARLRDANAPVADALEGAKWRPKRTGWRRRVVADEHGDVVMVRRGMGAEMLVLVVGGVRSALAASRIVTLGVVAVVAVLAVAAASGSLVARSVTSTALMALGVLVGTSVLTLLTFARADDGDDSEDTEDIEGVVCDTSA